MAVTSFIHLLFTFYASMSATAGACQAIRIPAVFQKTFKTRALSVKIKVLEKILKNTEL
jgi:hypothetical protein